MLRIPAIPTLIAAALLAGGCASSDPKSHRDFWEEQVRRLGLDPGSLVNPVAYTPEMRQIARQVAGPGETQQRLARLQSYLFDDQRFPFTYDGEATFTAIEAFEHRRGNCVSFTNLFIALGRALDIPLDAALLFRGDSELDGNLVVVNTHMVAVYPQGDGLMIYDFAETRDRPLTGLWIINDLWISAIYLNNRGVEELRAGHHDAAVGFLETAVAVAPQFTASYGNLGVALRMNGDVGGALAVYERALEIDPRSATILNNLASLYRSLGQEDEARAALKAADLSDATPYLLITRGDLELHQGEPKAALRLYKRARRLDPKIPEPLVAIARLELKRGRPEAARRAVARGLALAPEHPDLLRLESRIAAQLP